ncbi:MAG TPA: hypothetical protein VF600_01715 [Abditibacteriaceae bacterium]|jgi:hypothetical protein
MQIFEITWKDKQLILTQSKASQLTHLAQYACILIILAFYGPTMVREARSFPLSILVPIMVIAACAGVAFLIARQLQAIVHGETWLFDTERQCIKRNSKELANLNQIQSVRVWEESIGDGGSTFRLALQPVDGKAIVIADSVSTERSQWEELARTAEQISAFTGIKVMLK